MLVRFHRKRGFFGPEMVGTTSGGLSTKKDWQVSIRLSIPGDYQTNIFAKKKEMVRRTCRQIHFVVALTKRKKVFSFQNCNRKSFHHLLFISPLKRYLT